MCRSKLAAEKFGHDNIVRQCYRSSIWDETLYKVYFHAGFILSTLSITFKIETLFDLGLVSYRLSFST